jgi:hypothetical protein
VIGKDNKSRVWRTGGVGGLLPLRSSCLGFQEQTPVGNLTEMRPEISDNLFNPAESCNVLHFFREGSTSNLSTELLL